MDNDVTYLNINVDEVIKQFQKVTSKIKYYSQKELSTLDVITLLEIIDWNQLKTIE